MIVVIDGYNMLRQIFPGDKGKLDPQRKYLIQQLAHYKNYKKNEISDLIIVFDAGPLHHATREVHKGVVVMFSGQQSNADEWIINYAKKNKNREVIVVTKDRGLIQECSKYHAESIDGSSFYQLVYNAIAEQSNNTNTLLYDEKIKKFEPIQSLYDEEFSEAETQTNKQALDFLMQQASVFTPKKDPIVEQNTPRSRKGAAQSLSKKEKKIYAKLKKL
ncbi:NYN domain-containing protein [Candidatus Dependentiae bacterium]|jgi:predicted RNA-binding protein with PIN domain|nr:NYN domain-containing protein [Candidatus Dependentiae bacterium]